MNGYAVRRGRRGKGGVQRSGIPAGEEVAPNFLRRCRIPPGCGFPLSRWSDGWGFPFSTGDGRKWGEQGRGDFVETGDHRLVAVFDLDGRFEENIAGGSADFWEVGDVSHPCGRRPGACGFHGVRPAGDRPSRARTGSQMGGEKGREAGSKAFSPTGKEPVAWPLTICQESEKRACTGYIFRRQKEGRSVVPKAPGYISGWDNHSILRCERSELDRKDGIRGRCGGRDGR